MNGALPSVIDELHAEHTSIHGERCGVLRGSHVPSACVAVRRSWVMAFPRDAEREYEQINRERINRRRREQWARDESVRHTRATYQATHREQRNRDVAAYRARIRADSDKYAAYLKKDRDAHRKDIPRTPPRCSYYSQLGPHSVRRCVRCPEAADWVVLGKMAQAGRCHEHARLARSRGHNVRPVTRQEYEQGYLAIRRPL